LGVGVYRGLTRIIYEGFYCNRRYAAATSPSVDGLALRSVNILFQVRFLSLATPCCIRSELVSSLVPQAVERTSLNVWPLISIRLLSPGYKFDEPIESDLIHLMNLFRYTCL
jgi:hypothetical protein